VRLGRYDEAMASYEQAAAAASGLRLADVEHRIADVRLRMGEPASAATHLEAALGILDGEAPDDPLRSLVLADLALTALRLGRPAEAEASAAAVLSAATSVDSGPAAVAQAYNVLGVLAAREGDLDLARERLGESLVRAETLADPSCAVAALNNLARLEAGAGDLPAALDAAHRALGMGEAYGDTHRSAALHDNLADLLHRAGREDEAREHQRQAAVLFATVDREPERRPEIWKLVEW
jgi:tetratricopeptide (TPR) repeat protein